jgi:predicted membrane protein (TIGR00267 family)
MIMGGLMDEEQQRLLNAAKEIHAHKLVQIRGYQSLVKRAKDEGIKQLLIQVCEEEEQYAALWLDRIRELGGKEETKSLLSDLKFRMMMSVLGTKGFFEWAVVGEEEGIQELAIQAEKIRDTATSETWSRFAAEERMHLERMRMEVLGMEAWQIGGGGGVRDMIFGANDGLVSTLAFVAGVVGAITDPYIVLLSGIAELFAGTISMGFGSYQSAKSELEVLEAESRREQVKKGKTPAEEAEELIQFYQAEGFMREEAEAIVKRIAEDRELPIQAVALEDLGLAPEELGNPVKAGVLCGISFGLAAIVPIVPFAVPALSCVDALIVSIAATLATLFGVGAMKTIFSRKNWLRSGLEMMIIGASAAGITYVIGTLFSLIV